VTGALLLLAALVFFMGNMVKYKILNHVVRPLTDFSKIVEGFQSGKSTALSLEALKAECSGFKELYSLHRSFIQMHSAVAGREAKLKKSEGDLKTALKEKETLLQEMHHRVKNNLNVVASLLSLQADQVRTARDARQALEESRNRIFSMAMIHEDLYKTDSFSRVNMENYLRNLLSQLVLYYGKESSIQVEVEAKDINLDIVHAVPCGIIINELVTNSLKYGFPAERKGRIGIRFFRDPGRPTYTLKVGDNGVGLPSGFEFEGNDSLGLELVKILSSQLGGKLSFRSEGDKVFTLEFSTDE
jgi:two-component sensor histidine kinase